MPEQFSVTVEKDVPMTTRDGTILRSDVYRPAGVDRGGVARDHGEIRESGKVGDDVTGAD